MNEGQALIETQRELRDMEARAEKAEAALAAAETETAKSNRALLQYEHNKRGVAKDADAERDEWRRIVTGLLSLPDGPDSRVGDRSSILVAAAHDAVKSSGESSGALGRLFAQRDEALAKVATARAVMAEEIARRFEELEPPTPRGYARQPVILVDDNEAAANFCRSLATLPAGLVVLSVEVVANARVELLEAHGRAERCECDKPCSTCGAIAALDAAGGER